MHKILLIASALLNAMPLAAEEMDGTYDNTLSVLYAVTQPGARAPEGDAFCEQSFGGFVGGEISGSYKIDTESMMMSATADYQGATVDLYPLGIAGTYAFMSDALPSVLTDLGVMRMNFNVSTDEATKESDVMFKGNDSFNCILSSHPAN